MVRVHLDPSPPFDVLKLSNRGKRIPSLPRGNVCFCITVMAVDDSGWNRPPELSWRRESHQ
jgi:hypothetical protein